MVELTLRISIYKMTYPSSLFAFPSQPPLSPTSFQVGVRSSNAGLGSDVSVTKSMDDPEVSHKEFGRLKAQERFAKILAEEDPS